MTESTNQTASETSSLRMILVMSAVGLVASLALVGTYRLTAPAIAANRAAYLQASLAKVSDGESLFTAYLAEPEGWRRAGPDDVGNRVFFGYRADSLTGLAVEASGQGYADVISLLYGFDPVCGCVVGMTVLASKETPGLGDKIEKDPVFQENFRQLVVVIDGAPAPVEMVKRGQKTDPWQIDAISGATVSSRAVTKILAGSTRELVETINRLGFPNQETP